MKLLRIGPQGWSLMVLEPGDVLLTGTPAGVASGCRDPKPYLADGELVELEVAGLGRHRCRVSGAAGTQSDAMVEAW